MGLKGLDDLIPCFGLCFDLLVVRPNSRPYYYVTASERVLPSALVILILSVKSAICRVVNNWVGVGLKNPNSVPDVSYCQKTRSGD
jgi:hypothetical protein